RRGRRRPSTTNSLGRSRRPWRWTSHPKTTGRHGGRPSRPGVSVSPPNPREGRIMADKSRGFPVVLENGGVERTAHTPHAYNKLKTEGFAEKQASPKSKAPAKTKSEK